jgi:hypothetical protein
MDDKDTTLVCLVNEAHIGESKVVLTILKTVQKHVISWNLDKWRFLPMWDAKEVTTVPFPLAHQGELDQEHQMLL